MVRKIFYSFHFKNDFWRVQQIRNIGAIKGNSPVAANRWEEIKKNGDEAIESWIDAEMKGKSCIVVLVGSDTAKRKWVKKEIKKAWKLRKGIVAVAINGLKDIKGEKSEEGENPLTQFTVGNKKLSDIFEFHTPPWFSSSKDVYAWISDNIENWVDDAIKIRKEFDA